jgi:hypothetical protein
LAYPCTGVFEEFKRLVSGNIYKFINAHACGTYQHSEHVGPISRPTLSVSFKILVTPVTR